jgi:hypothetical protein
MQETAAKRGSEDSTQETADKRGKTGIEPVRPSIHCKDP